MTKLDCPTVAGASRQKKREKIPATTWALAQTTESPSAKAVLLALAIAADADGEALVSQGALAFQTNQSIDSVQRRLKSLIKDGFLVRSREANPFKQTPCGYRLQFTME